MKDPRVPLTVTQTQRQLGVHWQAVRRMADAGLIERVPGTGPKGAWRMLLAPDATMASIQRDLLAAPDRIMSEEDGAVWWEKRQAAGIRGDVPNPPQIGLDVLACLKRKGGEIHAKAMCAYVHGPQPQWLALCAELTPKERWGGTYPLEHVADQLGVSDAAVRKLIRYGLIEEAKRLDRRRQIIFDGEMTLVGLRQRFMTHLPTCEPREALRMYSSVRKILGIGHLDPHPECIIVLAIDFVSDTGGKPGLTQLHQLIGGNGEQFYPLLKAWWAERDPLHYVHQPHKRSPGVAEPAAVLPLVNEALHELPDTILDPRRSSRTPEPSRNQLKHVAAVDHDQLRDTAFIVAFFGKATGIPKGSLDGALRCLSHHADAFRDVDVTDPTQVGSVMGVLHAEAMAAGAGRAVGMQRLMGWKYAHDIVEKFLARSPSNRTTYERFQIALPDDDVHLFKAIGRTQRELLVESDDRKQLRIAGLLDDPWALFDLVEQRAGRTVAWRDAARARVRHAIDTGEEFPISFAHDEDFESQESKDGVRGSTLIRQTLLCQIDTWSNITADLVNAGMAKSVSSTGGPEIDPLDADLFEHRYAVRYLGCRPREIGGDTCVPLTVQFHEARLFEVPKRMDEHALKVRTEFMRRMNLQNQTGSPPSGLGTYAGRERRRIARAYQELKGGVFVPLEEAASGEMVAWFDFRARQDSPARSAEFAALTLNDRDWEVATGPQGQSVYRFKGSPKGWGGKGDYLFSEESYELFGEVAGSLMSRFRRGRGTLVKPSYDMSEKHGPDHYGLQRGERAIAAIEMHTLVKLLSAGTSGYKRHVMRDIWNSVGRKAGVSKTSRMERMHHLDPASNDVYGKMTPSEKIAAFTPLRETIAERMAASHPALLDVVGVAHRPLAPEDIDELTYRMRRARNSAEFFEAEGRSLPAIESRQEERFLAARIAEIESRRS